MKDREYVKFTKYSESVKRPSRTTLIWSVTFRKETIETNQTFYGFDWVSLTFLPVYII